MAVVRLKEFDEDKHPRDEHGRWTDAGGSDSADGSEGGAASGGTTAPSGGTYSNDDFIAVAEAQRGKPEAAMRHLQDVSGGGGVLSFVAEHDGDLIHRMAERYRGRYFGYELVKEKVERTLRTFNNRYGFEREHQENLESTAKYLKIPLSEHRANVERAQRAYGDAHRELKPLNQAQRHANNVAVAIGDSNWYGAIDNLYSLKHVLDEGKDAWAKFAGEGLAAEKKHAVVRLGKEFDPDQPRDENGRWSETGGGDGSESGGGRGESSSATTERLEPSDRSPIQKPPHEPVASARAGADSYNAERGLAPIRHGKYVEVDVSRAQRIAEFYDSAPAVDGSPETAAAYAALASEIEDQWRYAEDKLGMTFEAWTKEGQPYANSKEMRDDVAANKHLYFFTGGEPHPFLSAPGPDGLTANDKFRAVHDYFGHAADGLGFGARGEENAWLVHSQMFSPAAQRAMTTETRGQNSWVNFGKQNYNADGSPKNIPAKDRPYAIQKVVLLPEWATDWRSVMDAKKAVLVRDLLDAIREELNSSDVLIFGKEFDEDKHPRDDRGRWTDAGGSDNDSDSATHEAPRTEPMFAEGTTAEYDKVINVVSAALAFEPEEGEPDIKHRVLFHSNSRVDAATLRNGLEPVLGGWVRENLASGTDEDIDWDEYSVPVVFLSDDPKWVEMQVARKLDKPLSDVTDEDVRAHGVLAVVTNVDTEAGGAKHDDIYRVGATVDGAQTEVEDPYGKTRKLYETSLYEGSSFGPEKEPQGLEPGDFVTASPIVPDAVLTGNDLVQFIGDWRGGIGRRSKHVVVRLDKEFDEDKHPRDEHGRWTSTGGGSDGDGASSASAVASQVTEPVSSQTKTPAFKRWFGESKIVDDDGEPLVLYHGTTGDFSEFERERANPESDLGAGFYFTNNSYDVSDNYAGEGPDLTQRLENRTEQIAGELEDEHPDWTSDQIASTASAAAREELAVKNGGLGMPVYLSIQNPVTIGGDRETRLDWNAGMDEEGEYTGEDTGKAVEFYNALHSVAGEYHDGDLEDFSSKYVERAIDGDISASDIYKLAEKSEAFNYYTDDEGRLVSKEILRRAFEEVGFDGIVDHTVNEKFGTDRQIGRPMSGVSEDTIHYVAFRPEQIKSAIGNSGSFDPDERDITKEFDEDKHPRDENGRWTSSGGGGDDGERARAPSVAGGGRTTSGGRVAIAEPITVDDRRPFAEQGLTRDEFLDKFDPRATNAAVGNDPSMAYRSMSEAEYAATVEAGLGVRSDGRWRARDVERTNFGEDFATALHYQIGGRTDPRDTGEPVFIVEVPRSALEPNEFDRGNFHGETDDVRRVWEIDPVGESLAATLIKHDSKKFLGDIMSWQRLEDAGLLSSPPTLEKVAAAGLTDEEFTLLWQFYSKEFDEDKHPRDDRGRWTSGGGGGGEAGSDGGSKAPSGDSNDDEQYRKDDGKYHVKGDVEAAVRLIGEGKDVVLEQPRELSTLVDRLAAIGKSGDKRVYDLCRVSVSGTNLFCTESAGYARVDMPQLSGPATPGSIADTTLPKDSKGGVDATPLFVENLRSKGYDVKSTTEDAGYLRATQRELDGAKVAGMMKAIQEGKIKDEALVVSKDNYIIDGHHRWAAKVALAYAAQVKMDMPILKVDIPVVPLVEEAKAFANKVGIPQRAVGKNFCATCVKLDVTTLAKLHEKKPGVAYLARSHHYEDEPRDESGKWTSGGGGSSISDGGPETGGGGGSGGGRMQEMFSRISKPDGGFTYQPATGQEPTSGFAVSIYPERSFGVDADKLQFNDLVEYASKNNDLFEKPDHFIGAWHDPASHRVFLDVSVVTSLTHEAETLARNHDQIAYFDLGGGKSVTVNPEATSGGAAKGYGRQTEIESTQGGQDADGGTARRALRKTDGQKAERAGTRSGPSAARRKPVTLDADTLRSVRRRGVVYAQKYSDEQPRDDDGKWTSGGGGGNSISDGSEIGSAGGGASPSDEFDPDREVTVVASDATGKDYDDGVLERVRESDVMTAEQRLADEGYSPEYMRERLVEQMEVGRANPEIWQEGMEWYANEGKTAAELAAAPKNFDLSEDQASAVLAACSPRTSVEGARKGAGAIVQAVDEDGTVSVTPEVVEALYQKRVAAIESMPAGERAAALKIAEDKRERGLKYDIGEYDVLTGDAGLVAEYHPLRNAIFASNWGKGLRIARGEPVEDVLSGPKVWSFYDNIRNPDSSRATTIDGWMVRVVTGNIDSGISEKDLGKLLGNTPQGRKTSGRYEVISRRIREVADAYKVTPLQAQAITWIAAGGGRRGGAVPPEYAGRR